MNDKENTDDISIEAPATHYDILLEKMNSMTEKMNSINTSMTERMNSMAEKINSVNTSMTERINSVNTSMTERMNSIQTNMTEKINSVNANIKTIYWILGIHFAITLTGFSLIFSQLFNF